VIDVDRVQTLGPNLHGRLVVAVATHQRSLRNQTNWSVVWRLLTLKGQQRNERTPPSPRLDAVNTPPPERRWLQVTA
jgi:hypothetical protein